jgi:predicted RecA/RadA family phage recombinase
MPLESQLVQAEPCTLDYTPTVNVTAGQVIQVPGSRAGIPASDIAANQLGAVTVAGIFRVAKSTATAFLKGGRVYWNHAANNATFKPVNGRDFYVGTAIADAAQTDTTVLVSLNTLPVADIDLPRDAVLSVLVGTVAAGGFGYPQPFGGAQALSLTATNEAQKVDMLSVDRRAVSANAIAEFVIRLGANGSTNAVDLSVGVANGTHASDADAIAEHLLFHVDGGALDLFAQSKDGTTTVAAIDTTKDLTAGSAVANRCELWIDMRDPADVQLYVDGVNVLPDTVFRLDAATGPLGLLVHWEKSASAATAGPIYIDRGLLRTAEE